MKHILLILCLIACQMDLRAQSPRIDSLRQCVEEKGMPAKEYLFKCFETADIVVLGERDTATPSSTTSYSTCWPTRASPAK